MRFPSPSGRTRTERPKSGVPVEPRLTEGELWARAELARLRARRFSPLALAAFVWASSRRSAEVRDARPELARQSQRWMAVGALAWIVPAIRGVEPWRRCWRSGVAWWALTSVMLDWHLGMFETACGAPRELGAADALTLTRAWLVPLAAERPTVAICGLGALTDLLDGPLARRSAPTRAGRDLEGLVDVCFTLGALRGAKRHRLLGTMPVKAEATRLTAGIAYATLVYFGRARPPRPGLLRAARATTVLRMAGLMRAAAGGRRAGDVLLSAGSAASVVLIARSLAEQRRTRGASSLEQ